MIIQPEKRAASCRSCPDEAEQPSLATLIMGLVGLSRGCGIHDAPQDELIRPGPGTMMDEASSSHY